jgi:hypothetical protein
MMPRDTLNSMRQASDSSEAVGVLAYGRGGSYRSRLWRFVPRFRIWTWALLLAAVLMGKMFWGSTAVWQPRLIVSSNSRNPFGGLGWGVANWAPSADCKYLAVRIGQTISIYDLRTLHIINSIPMSRDPYVLHLSANARTLLTIDNRDDLLVVDLATGKPTIHIMGRSRLPFGTTVLLAADGTRMAIYSPSGTELWDCAAGRRIVTHPSFRQIRFTRNSLFLCCEDEQRVQFFNATDGSLDSITPLPHAYELNGGLISDIRLDPNPPLPHSVSDYGWFRTNADGSTIAFFENVSASKNLLHVIDRKTGKDRISPMPCGPEPEEIIFMPDGAGLHIIEDTLYQDGYTYVDLATGGTVKRNIPTAQNQFPLESPDSRFVACNGKSGLLILDARALITVATLPGGIEFARNEFSPDGQRLLVNMPNDSLRLYDTTNWEWRSTIRSKDVTDSMFLSTGSILTIQSHDTLTIWSQHRPDAWYGIAALWEFWLAVFAVAAFVVSAICDARRWYRPST